MAGYFVTIIKASPSVIVNPPSIKKMNLNQSKEIALKTMRPQNDCSNNG